MQCVRYRLAVPVARIVDRDDEMKIPLPAHLRASLYPVREFNGCRHQHGVINNRFPLRYAISFEPFGRELDVPANLASHPAFSSARCILHHMDIERWTREKFAFFHYPHSFTPSSRPFRLGA